MQTHPDRIVGKSPPNPSGDSSALTGRLAEIQLSSILTLLGIEEKSGLLTLSSDLTGACGRIFLRQGSVVRAYFDGIEKPENFEAVQAMLRWSRGVFEFHTAPVDFEDEVGMSTPRLILEAARRHDETTRIR